MWRSGGATCTASAGSASSRPPRAWCCCRRRWQCPRSRRSRCSRSSSPWSSHTSTCTSPSSERGFARSFIRLSAMELGVYTFGDVGPGVTAQHRLAQLMEEIELADQVGLDVFGVGEHHRDDYAVSAPAVVLAAGAARTQRIRLTSAVTVLSSDDPVRVFQDFATLDLLSGGRAEIMAGRGSFIESFPLFGFDLDDYEQLFADKLELLLVLRDNERVTWSGKHRAPIDNLIVYPRPVQNPLPGRVAVG